MVSGSCVPYLVLECSSEDSHGQASYAYALARGIDCTGGYTLNESVVGKSPLRQNKK